MLRYNKKEEFLEIYDKEVDALFRFLLGRMGDREEAKDIVSESFLRLWQSMQSEKIENMRAYLYKVARNKLIDYYRKKKPQSLESLEENDEGEQIFEMEDGSALQRIVQESEGKVVMKALLEVSSSNRDVLYQRFVEGRGPKEIAEILGITANAVSIRINRGIEELRNILNIEIENY